MAKAKAKASRVRRRSFRVPDAVIRCSLFVIRYLLFVTCYLHLAVLSKVPLTILYTFNLQSILKSLFSNVHEIATMAVLLALSIIWLYSKITKSSK